jgi:hypothetical protein
MVGSKAAWASFAPVVLAAASARAQATPPIPEPTYYGATNVYLEAAAPPDVAKPEEPAPPFGAKGEFVVTGASNIGISYTQFDASQATFLSASFSPSFDYFVLRNVSVGVNVDAEYLDERGYGADSSLVRTRSTTISGGVRVGVNVPILDHVSWYPRLTIGFEVDQSEQDLISGGSISVAGSPLGYPSSTQTGPTLNVFAPLLVHIAPHLFIGWGPFFFHDLASVAGGPNVGGQRTDVGADFVVGTWWGGAPPPLAQDAPPTPLRVARVRRIRAVRLARPRPHRSVQPASEQREPKLVLRREPARGRVGQLKPSVHPY